MAYLSSMNKYWAVMYKYNEGLIFGGTHEPAFCMTIVSVFRDRFMYGA